MRVLRVHSLMRRGGMVAPLATILCLAVPATAARAPGHRSGTWTTAWGASQTAGAEIPWMANCKAGSGLTDTTVRNVIFLSAGGEALRIRLSNVFGSTALAVGHASVAVQATGAEPAEGTLRELTFAGQRQVTVAPGGQALSDPVALPVEPLATVLVSVYVPGPTGSLTNHPFTAQGNFLASGDRALAAATGDFSADNPCWMMVDGVEVLSRNAVLGSVVALGDSITDTASTTADTNRRWPDALARRLTSRRGPTLSVVNAGLGGNRVLAPREGEPYWGVPALARLHRDVFAQTGARDVILFEGINDLGYDVTAEQLIAGYQQIIAQTRARGLRIHGGTMTPFKGSFLWSEERAVTWRAVNEWIRTSGAFDGVFDFAAATADPRDPEQLAAVADSGDHLHPNDAGCQAIADAIDLRLLLRR